MSCCCGTQTEKCQCCKCQSGQEEKGSLLSMFVGPYPDEVLMQVLDGILVMWGATQIKSLKDSGPAIKEKSCPPTPSGPSQASCSPKPSSSACSIGRCTSFQSMNTSSCPSRSTCRKGKDSSMPSRRGKDSSMPSSPKSVCFNSSRINAASCCPRQPSACADFKHPADDIRKPKSASSSMKERFMQAEILCSAACQALKSRLKPKKSPQDGCEGKQGKEWLWTRLVHTKHGCQMYEVYRESSGDCSPPKTASKKPAFIFLVLRNGNIMPFEAINTPV